MRRMHPHHPWAHHADKTVKRDVLQVKIFVTSISESKQQEHDQRQHYLQVFYTCYFTEAAGQ